MRRMLFCTAAGLLLAPLVGLTALGQDFKDRENNRLRDPETNGPGLVYFADKPVKPAPKPKAETTCNGDYGTNILFEETPKDAAAKAKKEEKLVLVLHVSGHFEDPGLT